MSRVFFIPIYLLIHTINSPTHKRKLENHLSNLTNILSYEVEKGCYSYEIKTNIHKKELIRLLGSFIKKLSLKKDDRIVLYDTRIWSNIFEKPGKNEKIILNGDIETENRIEEIIITLFRHIHMKHTLEEVEKRYFDSLMKNKK